MSRTIQVGLNRVEGDLEIKLEVAGNRIVDAWTSGTMYRGFEQILIGRSALDGLVITPRICGICGTAHQYAAVTALETAFNCAVAPNGTRVRNICLLAEEVQSDPKHVFLLFTPDLFNPKYRDEPWFAEALAYFEPLKGWVYKEVVKMTKTILEIVAIFGGQWPHSSYMLPGGVVTPPNPRKILESMAILDNYQRWYEKTILGCSSERWLAIKTLADLDVWLAERKEHHDSPAGLYIRVLRAIGLTELGRGKGNLLSFGVYNDPVTWQPPFTQHRHLRPSGFYSSATGKIAAFDHQAVTEHVKHSWYLDYEGGRHPWEGQTIPDYQVPSEKYSWAKA
ncbi:MAG: nickel-dependent hydrogenase large subunit, partial [Cyanobacteria bacterium NC_groundwater_1444_Ag_S-0.65um_54_12]|nr:nickel-dependent hydrogenase large subunit [Cyanobacteria bacterium NC_groundwater_1444_Ag_S-0.65um_54_12]